MLTNATKKAEALVRISILIGFCERKPCKFVISLEHQGILKTDYGNKICMLEKGILRNSVPS